MVKVNTTVCVVVRGAERQLKKIYGSKENTLHMLVCKYSKINATRDPYTMYIFPLLYSDVLLLTSTLDTNG